MNSVNGRKDQTLSQKKKERNPPWPMIGTVLICKYLQHECEILIRYVNPSQNPDLECLIPLGGGGVEMK
jgi:hypothetical protein